MSERRGFRRAARTRLLRDVEPWETSIPVHSTAAFSDAGEIFVEGERIAYKSKTAATFEQCERGASRAAGGSEPRFLSGGSDVTQSNPGDLTIMNDGLPVGARPNLDIMAGEGITLAVVDDANSDTTRITIATTGYLDATAAAAAGITLFEATANGTNKTTITAPASQAADYTLTTPAANGALAIQPTLTVRTTLSWGVAPNASQSQCCTCNANEVCVGGGYVAMHSGNQEVFNFYRSGNGWCVDWLNESGVYAQEQVQCECAYFGG